MIFQGVMERFGIDIYVWTNVAGAIAAMLCAIAMILLAWRRHARAGTATTWPSFNPLKYLNKDERRKFNPVALLLCFGAAYAVLLLTLGVMPRLLSPVYVMGSLVFMEGEVSFASGVLFFMPAALLLALLFPGNGRPTRQLELFMPVLALQHVFNRLACFFGNCCFGVPSRFGHAFPEGSVPAIAYGTGTRLFPNQLIESSVMLLCFAVILLLHFRGKQTLPIFPLVFGATGFLLGFAMSSFWQVLQPLFGFTYPGPFTHLLIFGIGLVFLVLQIVKHKHNAAARL